MELNKYHSKIIRELFFTKSLSSTSLSEKIKNSLPLTNKSLDQLIEKQVVELSGLADSNGGRRPQLYRLKKDVFYIMAIAIDQFLTRISILDLHKNEIISELSFDLNLSKNNYAFQQLKYFITQTIDQSNLNTENFLAIGICMPGFIDVKKGVNHTFFNNAEIEKNIVLELENEFHIPVVIDNDSSTIALAEKRFGLAKNKKHALVINLGWGIGLGIIANGQILRGNNGFAGEFSHIPLFSNNVLCSCGKKGCLETEASLLKIIEQAIDGINSKIQTLIRDISIDKPDHAIETIFKAANSGDGFAIKLLYETGYKIGRGIAVLIHILNPDLILISGRGAVIKNFWTAPLIQSINENTIPKISENIKIEISKLNQKAAIFGSCALVIENLDELLLHKKKLQQYFFNPP